MRPIVRCLVPVFLLCLLFSDPAPAAEERVLNFYNWADYIGADTLPDFAREFDVRVNYDLYNATDVVDAKLLSGNTGYDVVLQAARYSARLIPLGLFLPLDKQRLPNWENLDPWVLEVLARHDPGNRHTVPFMWGTTGFLYNRRMIEERLPGAPVDSARMLFDPEIARHFADCGISMLESSTTVIPMVMLYLGHDPSSMDPQHLAEAEAQLKSVRPYIRYFSSDRAINEMPTEDLCIAMAWSGDYGTARKTILDAGADVDLGFTVPREGTVLFFDTLAIPADAPHPGIAHEFLNYLMRPEVIARISMELGYGNANRASWDYLSEAFRNDPIAIPPQEVRERSDMVTIYEPTIERLRSRAWSRFKTGL